MHMRRNKSRLLVQRAFIVPQVIVHRVSFSTADHVFQHTTPPPTPNLHPHTRSAGGGSQVQQDLPILGQAQQLGAPCMLHRQLGQETHTNAHWCMRRAKQKITQCLALPPLQPHPRPAHPSKGTPSPPEHEAAQTPATRSTGPTFDHAPPAESMTFHRDLASVILAALWTSSTHESTLQPT